MSETKVAKAGKPVAVDMKINTGGESKKSQQSNGDGNGDGGEGNGNMGGGQQQQQSQQQQQQPKFTEEDMKNFLKDQGIEVASIEEIKTKFAPAAPQETDEQKKQKAIELEKRMVSSFVNKGGTVEQYAALKNVLTMDDTELARNTAITELKEAGITDDKEIDEIIKARYFQIELENIKRDEDNETEEDFQKRKSALQKKVDFGMNKMKGRSASVKKNAESILNNLRLGVEAEDAEASKEATFLSTVDKSLSALPRKITIDLGKENDQQLDPVQFNVTDAHIATVKDILTDPVKRKQYYLNEDGTINAEKAIQLILKNEHLTAMARESYFSGRTKAVNDFNSRFPNNAHALGVGGSSKQKQQGTKVVKAGSPVRVGTPS